MRLFLLLILIFMFGHAVFALPAPGIYYQDSTVTEGKPPVIQELTIYPNPARSGRARLELSKGEIAGIHLIDITGKKIIAKTPEQSASVSELSLSDVPDGIYFIRVKTSTNKVIVKKLVVSNR